MRTSLVLAALAFSSLAFACGAHTDSTGAESTSSDALGATITVTEAQNGATIHAKVGQTVTVRLGANPSTGYSWVPRYDRTIGAPAKTFEPSTSGAIGAPGTAVFTWKTSAGPLDVTGSHAISFGYMAPGAGPFDAPAKTMAFTLVIDAASPEVLVTDADNGKTIDANEGDDVVLKLSSNPSTGFRWKAVSFDRTIGAPVESFEASTSGAVGAPGLAVFTWATGGFLSTVGMHAISLEYGQPWDTTEPPARTFTFTINVHARVSAVAVADSDNGRTVNVPVGQKVVLSLDSNPSTGYGWQVVAFDRTFGAPSEAFVPSTSGAVGAGGKATFTWNTGAGPLDQRGDHTVKLEYKRPWDTTSPPARTFEFTAHVF